jgi:uncharacterized damage-inducible protein DinB
MKRRHLVKLTAAAAAMPAAALAAGSWSNEFAKAWYHSYVEHWKDTKEYTLQMLDAMPAEHFLSKPDPAQRTFGDQMRHLGSANVAYFRALNLVPVPDTIPSNREQLPKLVPENDKAAVRAYLAATFDYVMAVLDKMTEKDMARADMKLFNNPKPHSTIDLCMRAYMHTAHHRGQTVCYLRVKGITPPTWKFEPTAG